MNSQELAHRFFYNPEARGEYAGCNASFTSNRTYWSYHTRIAAIVLNRAGEECLLISDYKYSKTTAKHLRELHYACPYDCEHIIFVPNCEDSRYGFTYNMKWLTEYTLKQLNRKENREQFVRTLEMYDNYVANFGDKEMPKECKLIRKRKSIADKLEYIRTKDAMSLDRLIVKHEELQARIAEREREIKAAMKKLSKSKLEHIRIAFERQTDGKTQVIAKRYREMLCNAKDSKGRNYSYVWTDDVHIRTSQGITMGLDVVKRLLSMWKNKLDIVGERAENYTILENTEESVKVGCHVIPTWNVVELCKRLAI